MNPIGRITSDEPHRMKHIKRTFLAVAALLACAWQSPVTAQVTGWPTKPVRLLVGFPGGSTPDIAARTHRRAAGQGAGPAGGGRQQARRLGQHRGRPGGQGDRRPHAGHRHQRQPDLVEDALSEAALRPGQGLHLPVADRHRAAGAGGAATSLPSGAAFFDAGAPGRRQAGATARSASARSATWAWNC